MLAKSFARIRWQNLANFGILALTFEDPADYERIDQGDTLALRGLRAALGRPDRRLGCENTTKGETYAVGHRLSGRQVEMVRAGGLIPVFKRRFTAQPA